MKRCCATWAVVSLLGIACLSAAQTSESGDSQATPFSLRCFAPDRRAVQRQFENALVGAASAERLRGWHELLGSEPHCTGTDGDLKVIDSLARSFREMGLETEVHWIWPYLSRPVAAELEILAPDPVALDLTEPPLDGDPYSTHPALTFPWNGMSGSGEAVGEVVYANYGRKEDFARLKELGIDVKGKIALARYGRNFRGYKAKFAEAAGAVGLIIYTDPADSGYMRGLMYPEGGWANERQVERGSITTLPYPGDPLTPGEPATENAKRLDPDKIDLPRIPVQPVSWSNAHEIMKRMKGAGVPDEWQGALPLPYRVTGGPDLRVRLKVQQKRDFIKTANVVARLPGAELPDEWIILGCHHDAWAFGAADPLAGTMVLVEAARCFADLAKQGLRPRRSILFGAWGAEEQGVVGSTEWVEAHKEELSRSAVMYINLDMASMGPLFNASGTPTLKQLVLDASMVVPQARQPDKSVFQDWSMRAKATGREAEPGVPRVGSMGGGSDHMGFYFHVGVPCMGMGGGGSRGTSYHSNYDNLHWYRKVVGEDYEPALMVTRVVSVTASRMANADLLPIDVAGYAQAMRDHLVEIKKKIDEAKLSVDLASLTLSLDEFETEARESRDAMTGWVGSGPSFDTLRQSLNAVIRSLERQWLTDEGLPGRPWYRSVFMAPDEDAGYASWPLPELRRAVERRDTDAAADACIALSDRLKAIQGQLNWARQHLHGKTPGIR